jgi:hypothetical protein
VQSFVQSSCIECVPIRYGIMCGKSGQMTIQLDLSCVHNCHNLFGNGLVRLLSLTIYRFEVQSRVRRSCTALERHIHRNLSARHEMTPGDHVFSTHHSDTWPNELGV